MSEVEVTADSQAMAALRAQSRQKPLKALESKDENKKRGRRSPDIADAGADICFPGAARQPRKSMRARSAATHYDPFAVPPSSALSATD